MGERPPRSERAMAACRGNASIVTFSRDGAGRFGLFFFPVLPTGRAAKGVGCFEAVALNSTAGREKVVTGNVLRRQEDCTALLSRNPL